MKRVVLFLAAAFCMAASARAQYQHVFRADNRHSYYGQDRRWQNGRREFFQERNRNMHGGPGFWRGNDDRRQQWSSNDRMFRRERDNRVHYYGQRFQSNQGVRVRTLGGNAGRAG